MNPNWRASLVTYFTTNRRANIQDVWKNLDFKEEDPKSTRFLNDNVGQNQLVFTQLDFSAYTNKIVFEFAPKFSAVKTKSILLFCDDALGSFQSRPDKSIDINYNEQPIALYGTMDYKWKKWHLKRGLRLEHKTPNGVASEPQDRNNHYYWALFPTVYVLYTTDIEYQSSFSYDKRIRRPEYSCLNPVKSFFNLFPYFQGDPRMKPTIIHNLNLMLTKKEWNVALFYRYEQ